MESVPSQPYKYSIRQYLGPSLGSIRIRRDYPSAREDKSGNAFFTAVIVLKDMERLATAAFNSRQVGLLHNTSGDLIPLAHCLLDQKCRDHFTLHLSR